MRGNASAAGFVQAVRINEVGAAELCLVPGEVVVVVRPSRIATAESSCAREIHTNKPHGIPPTHTTCANRVRPFICGNYTLFQSTLHTVPSTMLYKHVTYACTHPSPALVTNACTHPSDPHSHPAARISVTHSNTPRPPTSHMALRASLTCLHTVPGVRRQKTQAAGIVGL